MGKGFTLLSVGLLAGCASNVTSSWQCPNPSPRGNLCSNIADADKLAATTQQEQTKVDDKSTTSRAVTEDIVSSLPAKEVLAAKEDIAVKGTSDFIGPNIPQIPDIPELSDKPELLLKQRAPEMVARVWFAPFIDRYNNRHEESIIYIVDRESSWRTQ